MPSFSDQLSAARQTNLAVQALEGVARTKVSTVFDVLTSRETSARDARTELEHIVRGAYQSSASLGVAHIAGQVGVRRWQPEWVQSGSKPSSYLDGLIEDVRRNLNEFSRSDQGADARARAISRISHSAGVAAVRGQTDALLRSASELEENGGFILRKLWRASFDNHAPCELCADLHNTVIEISHEYKTKKSFKIYGDLKGPPLHPRCTCHLVILFIGLENLSDSPESPMPVMHTLTTEDVKKMKPRLFTRMVSWLRKLVRWLEA